MLVCNQSNHSLVKITCCTWQDHLATQSVSLPASPAPPPVPSPASVPVHMQCKTPGCTNTRRMMGDGSGYYDYCSLRCRDQGQQLPPFGIIHLLFTPMRSCMMLSRCSLLFCPWCKEDLGIILVRAYCEWEQVESHNYIRRAPLYILLPRISIT